MKKLCFISVLSLSCLGAFAQTASEADTLDATAVIVADTTGGNKQVPNDASFDRGDRRTPSDSTKTRYALGGKTARDAAHIKQHPARKDTTHVPMSTTTRKTTRSYHKTSASVKSTK